MTGSFSTLAFQLTTDSARTSLLDHLLAAVVFALLGLAIFGFCFWLCRRLAPFSIRKEIEADQNVALAIILGSFVIGMSIIIAAAIIG